MKFNMRIELPQLILVAAMFLLAAISWSLVPERIPVHWNFAGEVDRYGGKFEALLGIPLVTLVVYLLMLFLPRVDPGKPNYERFLSTYTVIRCVIVVFMCFVYGMLLLTAYGYAVSVSTVVPLAVGGLFIVLGNLMGKIRPNWFVGIRTPWTLSSKLSWNKTHRVGGWLFILMGLAIAGSGLIGNRWAFIGMGVIVVASLIWMIVYSYLVWKDDPDHIPPAGTRPGPN